MSKVSISLLWCALLSHAEFLLSNWQYRRPVPVDAGAQVAVFAIDRSVYIQSKPGLEDLRVVRGHDEVPYVLETMAGVHKRTEALSDVINQEVTASGDLELTVDSGGQRRHNGVRLATAETNFRQRVSVSTSDDSRHWTLVRDDGYIFDFRQDGRHVSVLDVSYPVSLRRYVQLTVRGWKDPGAVTQCWLALEEDKPPMRDEVAALAVAPNQDPKSQSTVFTWDLGVAGIPHDALTVAVNTPEFQRAAAVETSEDNKSWSALGQSVLSRFQNEQSLTLNFPENADRYLRLRVFNRDDQPLAVERAALSVTRRRVKFRTDVSGSYWLYYGNADAHTPAYDLAQVMERSPTIVEAALHPGPEERNPSYQQKPMPVKPWSERHPGILYLTLAVAVVSMGTITIRFLRKVGAENR